MISQKLNIVVTMYNSAKYIERCLSSILKSIYASGYDIQITLINDGSTDDSLNIATKYLFLCSYQNVRTINFSENHGLSYVREYAIQNIICDYICFVDHDDTLEENYVNNLLATLGYNNNPDIIATSVTYNTPTGNKSFYTPININNKQKFKKILIMEEIFSEKIYPCIPFFVYRREFLLYVFRNHKTFQYNYWEDYANIYIWFALAKNIVLSVNCIYQYTLHSRGMSKKLTLETLTDLHKAYGDRLKFIFIHYSGSRMRHYTKLCKANYLDRLKTLYSMGVIPDECKNDELAIFSDLTKKMEIIQNELKR